MITNFIQLAKAHKRRIVLPEKALRKIRQMISLSTTLLRQSHGSPRFGWRLCCRR